MPSIIAEEPGLALRKSRPGVAHAPNRIWCWDVTYLPSRVRGLFFYLFAIIDLYSRKLIAWEVHPCENGELA